MEINKSSKHNPTEKKKLPELLTEVVKCCALKIRKPLSERAQHVLNNAKGEKMECNIIFENKFNIF
jgi:hypothetical protein